MSRPLERVQGSSLDITQSGKRGETDVTPTENRVRERVLPRDESWQEPPADFSSETILRNISGLPGDGPRKIRAQDPLLLFDG